jgi:uncharacterized membrane protein
MLMTIRHQWQEMRSSFWFVPTAIVVGAVALAAFLIQVDAATDFDFVERWPLFFGAGADGARGLLTAVATSMITVAGVVFSITILALSQTSSQYTSRVLRNFMRDAVNQVVLGVFVGIFAYCLVVLRTIHGGDEGAFVPSLAVFAGLLLAFVGIVFLIYYIHHVALSIQAASIIAAAARETLTAVDHLFPAGLGEGLMDDADIDRAREPSDHEWTSVVAATSGYIASVDGEALLEAACERDLILRMERGVGEFVVEGTPLISVAGDGAPDDEMISKLNSAYLVGRQRTVQQDAGFGIRQLVDIAMKALSPGINDATTAVMCIDYLTAIMARLAAREFASSHRLKRGKLRLIARGPSFDSLLAEAFDQIRQNAEGNVAVLDRLIQALETIAYVAKEPRRRQALARQAEAIAAIATRTISWPEDGVGLESAVGRLLARLNSNPR